MAKYNEKNFNQDKPNTYSIDTLIGKDEEILLRTKPNKNAFIVSQILHMLPFALLWIFFDGFMIYMMVANDIFSHIPTFAIIFIVTSKICDIAFLYDLLTDAKYPINYRR